LLEISVCYQRRRFSSDHGETIFLWPYERLRHRLPPLLLIFAEVAKDVADDFYPAEPQDYQSPSGQQRAEAYAETRFALWSGH
jgi:hypothetical protein